MIRNIIVTVFLALGTFLFADTGWIYILGRDSDQVYVMDAQQKEIVADIAVSGKDPTALFPAPSGKYLFVTFQGSLTLSIIDTEEQREIKTISLEDLSDSPRRASIDTLTFSPMGEWVYVTYSGSSEITAFHHAKLVLEERQRFSLGNTGAPLVFNRRGTRFYRSSRKGLSVGYIKTNEVIREISLPRASRIWTFSPDFRYLWGAGLNGEAVVVVDEKSNRLVTTLDFKVKPEKPVFSQDGRRVYLIEEDGLTVRSVNSRSRKPIGEIPFALPVDTLASDDAGLLWAGSVGTAAVFRVDPDSSEKPEEIPLPVQPLQLEFIKLRQGEGFACF